MCPSISDPRTSGLKKYLKYQASVVVCLPEIASRISVVCDSFLSEVVIDLSQYAMHLEEILDDMSQR